jgi:hypothetical protein
MENGNNLENFSVYKEGEKEMKNLIDEIKLELDEMTKVYAEVKKELQENENYLEKELECLKQMNEIAVEIGREKDPGTREESIKNYIQYLKDYIERLDGMFKALEAEKDKYLKVMLEMRFFHGKTQEFLENFKSKWEN